MNSVTTAAAFTEALSVQYPWLMLFVMIALQSTIVIAAAALLTRFCQQDSAWKHRIWTTVVATLCLIPIFQLAYVGWTYPIHYQLVDSDSAEIDERPLLNNEQAPTTNYEPAIEPIQALDLNDSSFDQEVVSVPPVFQSAAHPVKSLTKRPHDTAQKHWLPSIDLQFVVVAIYLIGFSISILRLVFGTRWLSRIYRDGNRLPTDALELATTVATQIGLRRVPEVRSSSHISMPLVFGIFHGAVLVPEDFARWPQIQQRSALLHEMTHVKRWDVMVELWTRVVRALHWYHPAVWYVARQVTITRELATDQAVVRYGEDPCQYATGLVDVFARLDSNAETSVHPGVAMSRILTLESRVRGILQARQSIVSSLRGKLLLATTILVAVFTTVQLEFSQAADNDSTSKYISEILPADNDLFNRLRDCEVLKVEGEEYEAEFFVSGQVLDSRSQPVANAIVVLRESSTARISSERTIYLETDQRDLVRTKDVFARTTTDAEGRFVIDGAKAPALPSTWGNSWNGSIVAGHPDLGIGWVWLGSSPVRRRTESGVSIVLQETTTIEGRYLALDGAPQNNQVIRILSLQLPKATFTNMQRNKLDLQSSQLSPMLNTSNDGRIRFSNIPKGFVASIYAGVSDQWMGGSTLVATSSEIELGPQSDWHQRPTGETFVGTPFVMMADPGILFEGTVVDPSGNPEPNTKVTLSSTLYSKTSDANGKIQLRLRRSYLDRERNSLKFLLQPTQEDLLNSYQDVATDVIKANQPITFTLNRGVKISGRVVTEDGIPAANVGLMLKDPWQAFKGEKTDQDGNYTIYLPPGEHTLFWYDDDNNYQLPSYIDILRSRSTADPNLPKVTVEVIAGEELVLEPFIVEPVEKIKLKVLVKLPDGAPAEGASIIVLESDNDRFERQLADLTDSEGKASIALNNARLKDALIEAKLDTPTKSYSGSLLLRNQADDENVVELIPDWLLRGRVLVDGQGVAGAIVQAHEQVAVPGSPNAYQRKNSQTGTTGPDGRYEFRVRANKDYAVFLQHVPGIEETPPSNPVPRRVSDGVIEASDYEFKTGSKEIAGIVVDLDGKPIEDAVVEVHRGVNADPARWQGHQENSQFATDTDGRFVLRQVPAGAYQLRLRSAKGNPANSTLVKATAGDCDLRLVIDRHLPPELPTLRFKETLSLPKPGSPEKRPVENGAKHSDVAKSEDVESVYIRGRLVADNGAPIVGASLTCVMITNNDRRMYRSYPPVTNSTETDGNGYFTAQATNETLQIKWKCSAQGFATRNIDMPVTEPEGFEAQLERAAAIEGRLVRSGKPLPNVKVGLVEEDRSYPKISFPRELTTDEEGRFRFDDLTSNEKYVVYTYIGEETEGVLPESLITAPGTGELAMLGDLEAEKPQTITVSVQTLDGQPIPEESSIYLGRRKAYQGLRLPLDSNAQGEATLTLPGVGREVVGISLRVPGYETIRSIPNLIPDMNGTYQLNTSRTTNFTLFLQAKNE